MKKLSKKEQELRTIIREQVLAELNRQSQRLFLNSSENAKRILNLEVSQACLKSEIRVFKTLPEIKRISYCPHKIFAFKSVQYLKESSVLSSVTYKCESCRLEWLKLPCFLTRKEKKALSLLGVITK